MHQTASPERGTTGVSVHSCGRCAELRAKLRDALVAQRRLELDVARREEESNLLRILASRLRPMILPDQGDRDHGTLRHIVLELIEALENAEQEAQWRYGNGLSAPPCNITAVETKSGAAARGSNSCSVLTEADSLEFCPDPQVMKQMKNPMQELSILQAQDELQEKTDRLSRRYEELKTDQEALEALNHQQSRELARLRSENHQLRINRRKAATTPSKRTTTSPSMPETAVETPPELKSTQKASSRPPRTPARSRGALHQNTTSPRNFTPAQRPQTSPRSESADVSADWRDSLRH